MSFSLTLVIVAVTVLVSWRAFNDRTLLERLILWPPAVERRKQYDRLLSAGRAVLRQRPSLAGHELRIDMVALAPGRFPRHRHDVAPFGRADR